MKNIDFPEHFSKFELTINQKYNKVWIITLRSIYHKLPNIYTAETEYI